MTTRAFEFNDEQVLTIITALGVLKDRIGQKAGWQQRKRLPTLRGRLADCITIGDETEAEIAKRRRHDQFIASQNYRKSVDFFHDILGWDKDD